MIGVGLEEVAVVVVVDDGVGAEGGAGSRRLCAEVGGVDAALLVVVHLVVRRRRRACEQGAGSRSGSSGPGGWVRWSHQRRTGANGRQRTQIQRQISVLGRRQVEMSVVQRRH